MADGVAHILQNSQRDAKLGDTNKVERTPMLRMIRLIDSCLSGSLPSAIAFHYLASHLTSGYLFTLVLACRRRSISG